MLVETFKADDFSHLTSSINGWLSKNSHIIESVLHMSHSSAVRFQSNNTIQYTCIIMYTKIADKHTENFSSTSMLH